MATVADIKQGNSKLRNRVIGRIFKELRYIEQWGSGILNAIGECKTMGLPEPEPALALLFQTTRSAHEALRVAGRTKDATSCAPEHVGN
jgi:predicted HTH transcriptional regulator